MGDDHAPVILSNPRGSFQLKEKLVVKERLHSFHDFTPATFGHRSLEARTTSRLHVVSSQFLHSNQEHQRTGICPGYFVPCLQAVHVWHAQVQDHKIRRMPRSLFDSLDAVGRFVAYLPIGMILKKPSQQNTDCGIIVRNQDSHSHMTGQKQGRAASVRSPLAGPGNPATLFALPYGEVGSLT